MNHRVQVMFRRVNIQDLYYENFKELDVTIHNNRLLLVAVVLIRSHYGLSHNKL